MKMEIQTKQACSAGERHNDFTEPVVRLENDGYQTPIDSITPLLHYVDLIRGDPDYLEPCRGDGNIYDLIPCLRKDYCEITEGKDYFKQRFTGIDIIITNPPFNQALAFLEKSLSEADTVIYLLRLNFLASQKRKEFWKANTPTHLFVLSKRPSFTGSGTDNTDYMWCCWNRGNRIKTTQPFIFL